jgi:hypothetical protein
MLAHEKALGLAGILEVTNVVIPRLSITEFVCRGGISHASLKSVCAKAETREPARGGDFEVKKQMFQ